MRPTGARVGGAVAYGLVVGTVAGIGMRHPGRPDGRVILVAAVCALPALVPAVPLFYVFGSMAWSVSGGEVPPPDVTLWPVTLTYGAIFAVAAFLNAPLWSGWVVAVGRDLRCRVRARRAG